MSMAGETEFEEISPSMRKYLGMPEVAEDYGTSEGAKKAAQTRKLHGGGVYNLDDEIIDHGMGDFGDEDHNTEHRGMFKTGSRNYEMATKSFPLSVRDAFLAHARGYKGDKDAVTTPEEIDKAGYAIRPGRRKGELKLMQKVEPSYGNHWNTVRDLEYSWRPKNLPRAKPGTAPKKESHPHIPYLDMSGTGMVGDNFEHHISEYPNWPSTAK